MISLRTMEGLSLAVVQQKWGSDKATSIQQTAKKFTGQQMMVLEKEQLILTRKGKLFADGIAAELFF